MKNFERVPVESLKDVPPGKRTDRPSESPKTAAQKLGITPSLGDAIALPSIVPGVPYLLVDSAWRILGANATGSGDWQYALMGYTQGRAPDVSMGVQFDTDPRAGGTTLRLGPPNDTKVLKVGTATNWEWALWDASSQPTYMVPQLRMKDVGGNAFNLTYVNGTATMALCADGTSDNWVYGGSDAYAPLAFTCRKFFLKRADIEALITAAWPDVTIDFNSFRTQDDTYELITGNKALAIYTASGLQNFVWTTEVFDCDDFSFVYKAQACIQAYKDKVARSYAVGILFGRSVNDAHAVNLFVNYLGALMVLEPDGGKLVSASDWVDKKGAPYVPFFFQF